MMQTQPFCADYLNFKVLLKIATTFDLIAYADWVREHQIELSTGYMRSCEDDAAVYGRMQYVRYLGIGV